MYLKWIHQWIQLWISYTREHNAQNEKETIASHSSSTFFMFSIYFFFSCNVYFLRTLPSPIPQHFILFFIAWFSSLLFYCCVRWWTKAFFAVQNWLLPHRSVRNQQGVEKINNQSQCFSRKKQEGTIFPTIITHVHLDGNTPDIGNRIYFKNKNRRTEKSLSRKF